MSSLALHHAANRKKKLVNVVLLSGEEYHVAVDVKSKYLDVFNQVTSYLSLRETEYFGLALKKDEEYLFLPLDEKIHKQAPKSWKTSTGDGLDGSGNPILTVYFRVHFYVDQFVLLREKVTRHLYYLQLKENMASFNQVCSEGKCFQMVSYALQADFGNYNSAKHGDGYFDPREYFPAWMVKRRGENYIVNNTPVMHKDLQNVSKSEAELRFIREASMSPAAHNLHFYRLRKRKTDKNYNAWLGVCAKGIEIYEEMEDSFKNLISIFLWPDIGKLHFEKKKFEIRSVGSPAGRKFAYYTDCDTKSKYLLYLCRTTHMFQMAIQPKLMEIRHLDAEDKRRYRESYIYSDTQDLVTNGGGFRGNLSPGPKGATRYSVVSDASSNTTSGIASDKMTISFEENDDQSKEIMIDSPPHFRTSPHQMRLKSEGIVSTLPNYMPSRGNKRSSPKMDGKSSEFFKSASVGRGIKQMDCSPSLGRPSLPRPSTSPIGRRIDRLSPSSTPALGAPSSTPVLGVHLSELSGQSGHSTHSSSTVFNSTELVHKSPSNSSLGSSQRRLSQQHSPSQHRVSQSNSPSQRRFSQQSPPFSALPRTVPVYIAHTPTSSFSHSDAISFSQPVSRSTSRADSFNKSLGHFHIHENDSLMPAVTNHATPMMDALSGNLALSSYPVNHLEMREIPYGLESEQEKFIPDMEMTLPEMSKDFLAPPPPMFADGVHDESTDSAISGSGVMEHKSAVSDVSSVETAGAESDENLKPESKGKKSSTQISVKNQNEVLHPELQEIRGQPSAFSSFSMITSLCNDKSLMQNSFTKVNGALCGSYDMSTIRSTDSRISHLSNDVDPRRLSSCYPHNSDTMVTMTTTRPFSWHSEHFDLDTQLAFMNSNVAMMPVNSEHSSVPHDLSGILVAPPSSWANSIGLDFTNRQVSNERYSPQTIASHLMIPPKISSGGHSTDRNINQKALKETFGIA